MKKSLVILAGGEGKRFGEDKIKALAPVGPNGETMMHYNIYDAVLAGCTNIVVILNPKYAEKIKTALEDSLGDFLKERGVSISFTVEKEEEIFPGQGPTLVGPGMALLDCREYLKDSRFVVINADDFYGRESIRAIFDYLCSLEEHSEKRYCLMAYQLQKTLNCQREVNRGFCKVDEAGDISDLEERREIQNVRDVNGCLERIFYGDNIACELEQPVSVNLFGFTPDVFYYLETEYIKYLRKVKNGETVAEYLLSTILGKLSRENYVKTHMLMTESELLGLTYEEDVEYVSKEILIHIQNGEYPEMIGKRLC